MFNRNDALSRFTAETGHLLIGGDGTYGKSSNGPWILATGHELKRIWYCDDTARERYFGDSETLIAFDTRITDRDYWGGVRLFLEWLWAGAVPSARGGWVKVAYKTIRRARFEAERREWEDVLPKAIVNWADDQIMRDIAENESQCCDNTRVALVGNTSQERRYRRQKERGCCGSTDWTATGPDGKVYMLGYNFGH